MPSALTKCSIRSGAERPLKRSDFISLESSDDDDDQSVKQTDFVGTEFSEKSEADSGCSATISHMKNMPNPLSMCSIRSGVERSFKRSDFVSLESSDDDNDQPVKQTDFVSVESSDDDSDCGLFKFLPLASRIAGTARLSENNNKAVAAEARENRLGCNLADSLQPASVAANLDCYTRSHHSTSTAHTLSSDGQSYTCSTVVDDGNSHLMSGSEYSFSTSKRQQKNLKAQNPEVLVS